MARKSKLNAGIIGLGIIGSRAAENLRKAGFQVFVWNRTPKPAPNFLASPAEVAGYAMSSRFSWPMPPRFFPSSNR